MKQGERDSRKRIASPIQLIGEVSSFAKDEVHVVPPDKWDHPVYGEEITSANVSEFVLQSPARIGPLQPA
jgi:hypothetical protein